MNHLSSIDDERRADSAEATLTMQTRSSTKAESRTSRKGKAGPTPWELAETNARPEVLGRRLFLIRHGDASEGTKDGDFGRHLSALGERQVQALAQRIASWQVDAILCSDKHRARETAAAIHQFHPDVPLIVDPILREVSRGKVTAYERGDPEQADLLDRLKAAWDLVLSTPYEVKVVVVHNGLIKYFLGRTINAAGVLKPRFHCTETGITGIQLRSRGPLLEFFNDTHHLTEEIATPGPKSPWIENTPRRVSG